MVVWPHGLGARTVTYWPGLNSGSLLPFAECVTIRRRLIEPIAFSAVAIQPEFPAPIPMNVRYFGCGHTGQRVVLRCDSRCCNPVIAGIVCFIVDIKKTGAGSPVFIDPQSYTPHDVVQLTVSIGAVSVGFCKALRQSEIQIALPTDKIGLFDGRAK